ncbi:MAG: hypothetical protein RL007_2429 [Bacteroidota bacterium]|jgi:hypothetical protein
MLVTNFNPSENDLRYINSVTRELESGISLEEMQRNITSLFAEFEKVPINGLVRNKMLDVSCHLGIYQSKVMSYRFTAESVTQQEGVEYLIQVLSLLKQSGSFEVPDNLYQLYRRWIVWEGQQIEVEELANDNWNYSVMRSQERDQLFIEVLNNRSAAYWDKLFLVDQEDYSVIETAIQQGNKQILNNLADKYRAGM